MARVDAVSAGVDGAKRNPDFFEFLKQNVNNPAILSAGRRIGTLGHVCLADRAT